MCSGAGAAYSAPEVTGTSSVTWAVVSCSSRLRPTRCSHARGQANGSACSPCPLGSLGAVHQASRPLTHREQLGPVGSLGYLAQDLSNGVAGAGPGRPHQLLGLEGPWRSRLRRQRGQAGRGAEDRRGRGDGGANAWRARRPRVDDFRRRRRRRWQGEHRSGRGGSADGRHHRLWQGGCSRALQRSGQVFCCHQLHRRARRARLREGCRRRRAGFWCRHRQAGFWGRGWRRHKWACLQGGGCFGRRRRHGRLHRQGNLHAGQAGRPLRVMQGAGARTRGVGGAGGGLAGAGCGDGAPKTLWKVTGAAGEGGGGGEGTVGGGAAGAPSAVARAWLAWNWASVGKSPVAPACCSARLRGRGGWGQAPGGVSRTRGAGSKAGQQPFFLLPTGCQQPTPPTPPPHLVTTSWPVASVAFKSMGGAGSAESCHEAPDPRCMGRQLSGVCRQGGGERTGGALHPAVHRRRQCCQRQLASAHRHGAPLAWLGVSDTAAMSPLPATSFSASLRKPPEVGRY